MAPHAVDLSVILAVTINAPTHLGLLHRNPILPELVRRHVDLVHLLDLPMTALTLESGRDVAVVSKLDVFRQAIDLIPLDRLFLLPVAL